MAGKEQFIPNQEVWELVNPAPWIDDFVEPKVVTPSRAEWFQGALEKLRQGDTFEALELIRSDKGLIEAQEVEHALEEKIHEALTNGKPITINADRFTSQVVRLEKENDIWSMTTLRIVTGQVVTTREEIQQPTFKIKFGDKARDLQLAIYDRSTFQPNGEMTEVIALSSETSRPNRFTLYVGTQPLLTRVDRYADPNCSRAYQDNGKTAWVVDVGEERQTAK